MDIITKNRLWTAILPTMRRWILIPQIKQLEQFLLQFRNLEFMQSLTVIWQMVQPENFVFSTEVLEIQTIHRYIEESRQLSILKTTMRQREVFILEYRYRYMEIKQEIRYAFEAYRHIMRLCDIQEKMFQLIQISPAEIIVELVYHYNIILNQLIIYQHRQYEVETPIGLSVEERFNLIESLRENGNTFTQQLLFLHEELIIQIIIRREKEIDKLEKNIKSQLILLNQQIKLFP